VSYTAAALDPTVESTLYISYFGATKHLSQSQVLPYLKELSKAGVAVTLLSFEERLADRDAERREVERLRRELADASIDWRPLRYHKRPSLLAKLYDVAVGTAYASYLTRTKGIAVVHARNHIPAAMALMLRSLFPVKLLFDMRGVMAEEYVDAGLWKEGGLPFRVTKWVEAKMFRRADAIVMLTRRIKKALKETSPHLGGAAPIEIIPCCVDLSLYRGVDGDGVRQRLGLTGKTVMVYTGSLGGWYLTDEMAELFATGCEAIPDLHFLVLTQSDHEMIAGALAKRGVTPDRYTILTAPSREVPRYLAAADFGVSLIKPCFSKLSSSPTKIGEYLASGLPILSTAGIGDLDELLGGERLGALVDRFDRGAYRAAIEQMKALLADRAAIQRRCREAAERHFSLDAVGREGYLRVYRYLGASS
jgi:glycosyltransferase involved in cell wall biosynthesis